MRVTLIAAVLMGAVLSAPALAAPTPGVTVQTEFNFRPGHRAVTGADGAVTVRAEEDGVYDVMVGEPLTTETVLHVTAGGSEAQISLPRDTIPGTRVIGFRLNAGDEIVIRVETGAAE